MAIKFVVTVDADVVIIGLVVAVSLLSGRPMRNEMKKKEETNSFACSVPSVIYIVDWWHH